MVRNDLKEAKKENLQKTPLFDIDVSRIKGFEDADQERLIDSLNISNILSEQRERFSESFFISDETKERIEEEMRLGFKLPSGTKNIEFKPSLVEGYYTIESEGNPLDTAIVKKILKRIIKSLQRRAKKNDDKDIQNDALILELNNIENFVYSMDDFEQLYLARKDIDELARRHQIGETRLSSFTPEDLIKLFYVLDRELGDDSVAGYYKDLDKELLDNGVVSNEDAGKGGNKTKLPQNIFNGLVTRGIIKEA